MEQGKIQFQGYLSVHKNSKNFRTMKISMLTVCIAAVTHKEQTYLQHDRHVTDQQHTCTYIGDYR